MDMKIAPKIITSAAKKAVKSPMVKGAAIGVATVKVADAFAKKKADADNGNGKTKAIALASTVIGGAAILFLTGKAMGASNDKAISKGLKLVKDGAKKLVGDIKNKPAGEKAAGALADVLDKAKVAKEKVQANPVVKEATEKLKSAGKKIKNSEGYKAASAKVKTKAASLKGTAVEKAKTAGEKAKTFFGEKAKILSEKVKSVLGAKGKQVAPEIAALPGAVTEVAAEAAKQV